MLGDFYGATGRLDEAIAIYREVVANAPDYPQGHYRLAELLLNHGDLKGASAAIDDILKHDATDRQAMVLRARIEMQTGDTISMKAAIADLQEVLKQEPNSRTGLYFMAEANFRSGQLDQARAFVGDLERNYPGHLPGEMMRAQIDRYWS